MALAEGIRAGAAFIEITTKNSGLVAGLRAASQRLQAFGASVTAMGNQLLFLGTALRAPLLEARRLFQEAGDKLHKMAARTGFSTEALSELSFAVEQSGQDIDVLEKGIRGMQRTIRNAERGLIVAADALSLLGIAFAELRNLSPEEQFTLLAERLSAIEDRTTRAAVAMEIFGRSGSQLLPLLSEGAAGIAALRQEARDLDLSFSEEDAQLAADFTDQLNRVRRQQIALQHVIGQALAPSNLAWQKIVQKMLKISAVWVSRNRELAVTIKDIGFYILIAGAALVVFGILASSIGAIVGLLAGVVSGLGTAIGVLGSAIAFLVTPLGLVIVAIAAFVTWMLTSTKQGATALNWLGRRFMALKESASLAFQGISDALAANDLSLAAKILWLSLKLAWQAGINELKSLWAGFKETFISEGNDMVLGLRLALNEGWSAIEVGWAETTAFLSKTWTQFTAWLTQGWNSAVGFLRKAWTRFRSWFSDNVDVDAEIARIEQETVERNRRIDAQTQAAVAEREKVRQREREQIEQVREGAANELIRAANEALARQRQEQEAEAESALEQARQEWLAAIEEAARKRREIEESRPDSVARYRRQLAEGGEEAERRQVAVIGTFNAAAVRGLQAAGPVDRIAKATEATAINTKELVNEIARKGGVLFAE